MDAATIIQDFSAKGVRLACTSRDTIQVSPSSSLSAADRALIVEHRAELLAELRKREHVNIVNIDSSHSPGARTILAPLTLTDKTEIRAWLAGIGETDSATIADVLAICERFPDTRQWCLREAESCPTREKRVARSVQEATEKRAVPTEQDGAASRTAAVEVSALALAFYNHLFGPGQATGCCYGRTNRYCPEGRRLRDTYYEAAKVAGKLT